MVMNRDSDNFPGFDELFCYLQILLAGFRIPARVVVDENDARSGFGNSMVEDLAGMDERAVEGPARYLNLAQKMVGAVKKEYDEDFMMEIPHHRADVFDDVLGSPDLIALAGTELP